MIFLLFLLGLYIIIGNYVNMTVPVCQCWNVDVVAEVTGDEGVLKGPHSR